MLHKAIVKKATLTICYQRVFYSIFRNSIRQYCKNHETYFIGEVETVSIAL